MDIQVVSKTVKQVVCDALVVGAVRTKTAQVATTVVLSETAKSVDVLLDGLIQQICADGEFKGKLGEAVRQGSILAEATNLARDLVNEPPNVLTPTELANRASAMARQSGLECEILDRPQMQELGMGGLLAVAQGSAEPPKFIVLRYRGASQNTSKGMALVGKGITFDTGGISLK